MKNLQLSLKKQWFEMTKLGIKPEDYREITPYWCAILLTWFGEKKSQKFWKKVLTRISKESILIYAEPILFNQNTMTLGYPKLTDSDRILKLEHKGIEIRTGNPEWGAEPDKLYFVIKHGSILQ